MAATNYFPSSDLYVPFTQIAAAAIPTQTIFVAPFPCMIQSVTVTYGTAAGATSTINFFKDTGTTAPGGGTAVCSAAFDMNTTTNTPQTGTLASAGTITLAAGDRLSVKVASGTATASALVHAGIIVTRV